MLHIKRLVLGVTALALFGAIVAAISWGLFALAANYGSESLIAVLILPVGLAIAYFFGALIQKGVNNEL